MEHAVRFVVVLVSVSSAAQGGEHRLLSPDGRIRVQISEPADPAHSVRYRVYFKDGLLLNDSPVALHFAEDFSELDLVDSERNSRDETFTVIYGKSSNARNHCNELTLHFEERKEPHRRLDIVFRAYNDGVAFRYVLPEQADLKEFELVEEAATFAFAGDPQAYLLPVGSYTSSYEGYYKISALNNVSPDSLIGLPMLIRCRDKVWAALLEADLRDYAGMYLAPVAGAPGVLVSRLSPHPDNPAIKVAGATPHQSPWRIIMIAERPCDLIESNLVLNLSEPCAIADTSWIKTGKTAFTWWNDFMLSRDVRGGLDTETIKHYIDFCANNGIEYYTLDGIENRAWYGGPIQPYEGAGITESVPEIDLPAVLEYGKEKNVGIRLWAHWQAVREHMDEAFPLYEQWGVHGVMLDFVDRDDQDVVKFYEHVLKKAADHHLTVTIHGTCKPTGLRRTYPNLLTREAVMNLEYNKWDLRGSTPEHELIVPFTRMLAGHLDYHQGGFRHVTMKEFTPSYTAPQIIGTRSRQLAMYVVYENPMPMVADYPDAYKDQKGFDFVKSVPTTWDETRVIDGAVGDYLIVARKKNNAWYLGAMTDENPRKISISLAFLGNGRFAATTYEDGAEAGTTPSDVTIETREISGGDTLQASLVAAGGLAARFELR